MVKWWVRSRLAIMMTLVPVAAFLAGKNVGHREGIARQIGGPGSFQTALVEWQDFNDRKVVLYLNDGANGYTFWFRMEPGFVHYSYAAKVFTCDNTNRESIKAAMDRARDWCKNEWDGGDTRIVGGWLKDRADDGDTSKERDKGTESFEFLEQLAEHDELMQLRKDVGAMALTIENLRNGKDR